jgi:3-oxoacyl-[acyl-carrier-protein] synthase II
MSQRRVVVTGLGAVTPIGIGVAAFWDGVTQGKHGFGPITRFDTSEFPVHFAAEVKDFDPSKYFSGKKLATSTVSCSTLSLRPWKPWGTAASTSRSSRKVVWAAIWASGIGGLEEIETTHRLCLEKGFRRMNPFFIPKLMINAAAGQIAIKFGIQGVNYAVSSACASAGHAIGLALRAIRTGEADVLITGGSEATITALGIGGFCALRALSERNDDPATASRPFNKDRDGFVVGEGAGGFVFEELEAARKRGAKIYAEVIGAGMTDDGYHISAPVPEGTSAADAMRLACQEGGISMDQVDYINAHGTSTPLNDVMETRAIHSAFGSHAKKLMVSSTKSQVGHLLGAAGAVGALASILAIHRQAAPPTINYITPDPECDLDYVPNEPRQARIHCAMSNCFGFGGHNVATLFRRLA